MPRAPLVRPAGAGRRRPPGLRSRRGRAVAARALLALAAGWAAGPPGPAAADDAQAVLASYAPEVREELREEGLALLDSGQDDKFITALVVFDKSPDVVLDLLRQTDRQTEFRPELKGAETVATFPDGTVEQQRMRIMFVNIRYHLRYRVDEDQRRITWQLYQELDNDLSEVSGFWELHPLDASRTLARFGTRVDVGAMPAFLQDYATRKNVPKTLENTRRWVDSGGTWRP